MKTLSYRDYNSAVMTPFGIPRAILFFYYFVLMCLTGNVIAAAEPLKRLLRMRGVFADSGQQETLLLNASTIGVSVSVVSAFVSGVLNDRVGPRITAVSAQLASLLGFYLMFAMPTESYALVALGMSLLGFTYSAVSISHTASAAYFPEKTTLAVTILCVANDVSLAIPSVLEWAAVKLGSLQLVVYGYCGLNALFILTEFLLIPGQGFTPTSAPVQDQHVEEERLVLHQSGRSVSRALQNRDTEVGAPQPVRQDNMKEWPIRQQLASPLYWIFVAFVAFSFFRKNYFSQLVLQIYTYIAEQTGRTDVQASSMAGTYGCLLPTTMVAAFLTGTLITKFGLVFGLTLVNTYGVLLYLVASIPSFPLQWLTIPFFNLFGSFIFGLMYAYLAGLFGFANLGTLQGILKIFVGAAGWLCSPWKSYVMPHLPSILMSNRIVLGASVLSYGVPAYVYWKMRKETLRSYDD